MKNKRIEQLEKELRSIAHQEGVNSVSGRFTPDLDFRSKLDELYREVANDICILIDKIEANDRNTTLEEWKQYKGIRNAIRDKYVLPSPTGLTQEFLEEVKERHNKDYPAEYWESGGKVEDVGKDINVPSKSAEEIEQRIRRICTYYSEFGEGTAGYSLSEEQFRQLFDFIDVLLREKEKHE